MLSPLLDAPRVANPIAMRMDPATTRPALKDGLCSDMTFHAASIRDQIRKYEWHRRPISLAALLLCEQTNHAKQLAELNRVLSSAGGHGHDFGSAAQTVAQQSILLTTALCDIHGPDPSLSMRQDEQHAVVHVKSSREHSVLSSNRRSQQANRASSIVSVLLLEKNS